MYISVFRNFALLNQPIFERFSNFCKNYIDYAKIPSEILKSADICTWNLTEKGLNLIFDSKIEYSKMVRYVSSIIAFNETINQNKPFVKIGYVNNKNIFVLKELEK